MPAPTARMAHGAFWAATRRMVLLAAFSHVGFLLLFVATGTPLLVGFNAASVAVYALSYVLLQRRTNRTALVLAWLELPTHSAMASLVVGWDSGFHYYLLLLVPVVMVGGTRWRVPLLAVLCAFFIGLHGLCRHWGPLDPPTPAVLAGLHALNTVLLFAIAGHVVGLYYRHLRRAERQLTDLATRDTLTGLYNRRHLVSCVYPVAAQALRQGLPTMLVMADIDHFKQVNDSCGHAAGDRVIAHIGQRLAQLTRAQDIVGRWGGEEFLLVLPGTGGAEAQVLAERIREACAADTVHHGGDALSVTLSLGVAELHPGEALEAAVARADAALYRSKAQGRNRVTRG